MKEEWKKPEYKECRWSATVYGDDQDDKSYREMEGLVKAYPEPQGHYFADLRLAFVAGAKAIIDEGLSARCSSPGLAFLRK